MMQVTKRIPFDDPNVLNLVRAMYVLSNIIIVSVYLFVGKKISAKNGTFFPLLATSGIPELTHQKQTRRR